ncbi:MAG: hypothetical protein H8K07_06255 [Nitrospira sp.]|nr:hypothetical protein [Nitrospira sp.]
MERRAASHTEEEEMNQRRKLLNAARRGDTKAISRLFELYQVRVLSGDQLAKVNRTATYMTPVKQSSKSKSARKNEKSSTSRAAKKPVKASKVAAVAANKEPAGPIKKSAKSPPKGK